MKRNEFKPYFTYLVVKDANDRDDYLEETWGLDSAIDILETNLLKYPNACIIRLKWISLEKLPIAYDKIRIELI